MREKYWQFLFQSIFFFFSFYLFSLTLNLYIIHFLGTELSLESTKTVEKAFIELIWAPHFR